MMAHALRLALVVLQVGILARLGTTIVVVHQEWVLLLVPHNLDWIDLVVILSYLVESITYSFLTLINLHVSRLIIWFANQLLLLLLLMMLGYLLN